MSAMDRRDFLKAGAAAGFAGLSGTGCAAVPGRFEAPGAADLLGLDMDGFLKSLDGTLGFLRSSSSLLGLVSLPAGGALPVDSGASADETLIRDGMRSLLLLSSFNELPEAGQAHPGMQARIWSAMDEADGTMLGLHQRLSALTPTERADVARGLREDPRLRRRVLEVLDSEGERAGVSPSRRAHLSSVGGHVMFRLRQSPSLFYDELSQKMEKVAGLELTPDQSERRLRAMMGEAAFLEKKERMLALARAWQSVPGVAQIAPLPSAGAASSADTPVGTVPVAKAPLVAPPKVLRLPVESGSLLVPAPEDGFGHPPPRGTWTLRAAGMLFGLSLLNCIGGGGLVAAGNFLGVILITQGAMQLVGGIVTVIVGGVQRIKSALGPEHP